MAIKTVTEYDNEKQVEVSVESDEDKNWEEGCYHIGCKLARKVAMFWLKAMEAVLHQQMEKSLRVECMRSRTATKLPLGKQCDRHIPYG